jgi:hypothetical protein
MADPKPTDPFEPSDDNHYPKPRPRPLPKFAAGAVIGAIGLFGFAGTASAGSEISFSTGCGSATVKVSSYLDIVNSVRVLIDGTVVKTFSTGHATGNLGAVSTDLSAGTHTLTWEDRVDGMDTYTGHAVTTFTIVGCAPQTTTTVPATTSSLPPVTIESTVPEVPTSLIETGTTSSVPQAIEHRLDEATTTTFPETTLSIGTAPVPPTTDVVQTTVSGSTNTLPATGTDTAGKVGFGVAFLALGGLCLRTSRRRPAVR